MRKHILMVLALFILISCESYNQDDYQEFVVVESYLIANRPLPEIRVSTTLPVDREYHFDEAALSGASIQVVLIGEDGEDEQAYGYMASEQTGVYVPESGQPVVLPRRTYRLDIDFNDRPEIIRAETTVPDNVIVTNQVRDTVVYQSSEQLELILAPTQKTQKQNIFVFDTIAQTPDIDNMTPFYRSIVDNGDSEVSEFFSNSSGLINEGNFDIKPDGSIELFFPWIGVAFFGENLIVTNSVDQNLSDLIRSQEVQLGGPTLSPGEIPNLIYNIEGGIGVFGSISTDSVTTVIQPPF